ncbi:hypothetical protein Franean1_2194 [Parafrankia sp. EAN1pec]|uniref:hypothetical protein n=1 Tax=Parafrankia sp. (strain EAN1pec) TaxID=298653 RepID=UPI00005402A8|nr:hypothetical protein Franean1_2194 [Frankia sp. EAN1pec]
MNTFDAREPEMGPPSGKRTTDGGPSARSAPGPAGAPAAQADRTAQVDQADDRVAPAASTPLGTTALPGTAAEPDASAYALVGDEPGFTTGTSGPAAPPDAVRDEPGDGDPATAGRPTPAGSTSAGPTPAGPTPGGPTPGGPTSAGSASAGPAGAGPTATEATSSGEPEGAWRQVLIDFVDHPRQAVEKADRLVDEAVRSLTDRISREHSGLRSAWHDHGEPSTEDLRKALRGYREFFEKILSAR